MSLHSIAALTRLTFFLPAAGAFGTVPPERVKFTIFAQSHADGVATHDHCQGEPTDVAPGPNWPIRGYACPECLSDCDHPKRHAAACSRTGICSDADEDEMISICACASHPIMNPYGECVSDVDSCPFAVGRNAHGGRSLCARIQNPYEEEELVDLQALPGKPWCSSRSNDKAECERSYLSGSVAKNGLPTATPCTMHGGGACVADWDLLEDCEYAPVAAMAAMAAMAAFCQAVAGRVDVQQLVPAEWCNTDERRDSPTACAAAFVGGEKAYALCEHDAAADSGNGACTAVEWVPFPPSVPGGRSAIDECGCNPECAA